MKITSVIFNKKTRQTVVDIDYKPGFSLRSMNTVVDCSIIRGNDISEERIREILIIDTKNYLMTKSLDQIARRIRSEREIKNYLTEKLFQIKSKDRFNLESNEIQKITSEIIESLSKNKYINDEEFTRQFIQSKSKRNQSTNKLKSDLIQKGISKDIITDIFNSNGEIDEFDSAIQLAEKKLTKIREIDLMKKKQKLSMYLGSKGYKWETIAKVMDRIF